MQVETLQQQMFMELHVTMQQQVKHDIHVQQVQTDHQV